MLFIRCDQEAIEQREHLSDAHASEPLLLRRAGDDQMMKPTSDKKHEPIELKE
jgi:hypothetical protein